MASKTTIQLATLSGIIDSDFVLVYDIDEPSDEKLKKMSYLDLSSAWANAGHTHGGVYEPVIGAKGTAFNKNFGTSSGDVAEGNHLHDDRYYTEGEVDSIVSTTSGTLRTDINNLTKDHGSLDGLSDDDHTQYFLANGSREFSGHLIPEMTGASGTVSARDIGSPTKKIRSLYAHDAYIDAGSLYVNNKKVIEDDMDIITITTDPDQHVKVKTTGTGNIYLNSEDEVDINAKGGVEFIVPSDNATKHINFTNQSVGGNITFTTQGTNGSVQFVAENDIDFTSTGGTINLGGTVDLGSATVDHGELVGRGDDDHTQYHNDTRGDIRYYQKSEVDTKDVWEVSGTQIQLKSAHAGKSVHTPTHLTIGGNLTVSGTTTTVNSEELTVTDKIITVNAGEAGAGLTGGTTAGMEVDRGSETNYHFVFDETDDNFQVGELGSMQPVATREDTPTDGAIPNWDAASFSFVTTGGKSITSVPTYTASIDNRLARYDGTGAIQGTGITIDDSDNVTGLESLKLGDGKFSYFGTDSDMSIQHTGAYGHIDNNTGGLYIDAATNVMLRIGAVAGLEVRSDYDVKVYNELIIKDSGKLESGQNVPTGSAILGYNGDFYASKVYNAIWNDIADFQALDEGVESVPGMCYYDTFNGARLCDTRCQKAVIGVLSDTFGFGVGSTETGAPFAVAGWVLAHVNGTPECGDVLTNDADGSLVVMSQAEKSMYPERIVAIYKKPEDAEFWGPAGSEIEVNGRHWVKVK